jgi:alpha-tubulin suppressor-like RCC1 family protein
MSHLAIIRSDGTLWACGFNANGQLGLGFNSALNILVLTQVGTDADWAEVSCGANHTMAIKTNGTLWAWGFNSNGELGLGDKTLRNTPTQVGTATDWKSVSAGFRSMDFAIGPFTSAIKTNGTLWAWGANEVGQLGDGTTVPKTSPRQVGLSTNWAQISSKGIGFSAAIKTDGTLWAWGRNNFGQLGLGDTTDKIIHRQVGTVANWRSVSVGIGSMSAIKTGGTLWTCGNNASGELGQGDLVNRSTLTQVGVETAWITLPDSQSSGTFAIKAV